MLEPLEDGASSREARRFRRISVCGGELLA